MWCKWSENGTTEVIRSSFMFRICFNSTEKCTNTLNAVYNRPVIDSFCLCRFTEKGNLEVLLFTIQSKMRANNQKVYIPREGKLISDINKVAFCHIAPFV